MNLTPEQYESLAKAVHVSKAGVTIDGTAESLNIPVDVFNQLQSELNKVAPDGSADAGPVQQFKLTEAQTEKLIVACKISGIAPTYLPTFMNTINSEYGGSMAQCVWLTPGGGAMLFANWMSAVDQGFGTVLNVAIYNGSARCVYPTAITG